MNLRCRGGDEAEKRHEVVGRGRDEEVKTGLGALGE
jgi:hypothetical protein